jgi:arsenite methyltransferase
MKGSRIAQAVQLPDYGIDAPGVRKGMFIAGGAGLTLALTATATGRNWEALPSWLVTVVVGLGLFIGVYGFLMGGYMTYGSRVGKLRTREKLLDLAADCGPGGETKRCWT